MKKVFVFLFAAASLTACNNAADSTQDAKDSLDSIANAKTEVIDSTYEEKKEAIDSLAERRDSISNAADTSNTN